MLTARPEGEKTAIIGRKRPPGQLRTAGDTRLRAQAHKLALASPGGRGARPAPAERLEQRRGVGITARLRLQALVVRLQTAAALGVDQHQLAYAARIEPVQRDPVRIVGAGRLLRSGGDRLASSASSARNTSATFCSPWSTVSR